MPLNIKLRQTSVTYREQMIAETFPSKAEQVSVILNSVVDQAA